MLLQLFYSWVMLCIFADEITGYEGIAGCGRVSSSLQ